MKKIYIFAAVLALLTLSLNAQYSQKATKNVQRVEKSKDAVKALDESIRDINSGTKDAPADAVSAPYYNTFNTSDERGQMGTYDANGDASSSNTQGKWGYAYVDDAQTDICARYVYHSSNTANDYIFIGVPVILQAGKTYRFSMDVWTGGYTEKYEVVMFDELTTASITSGTQIIPVTTTSSTTTTRVQSDPITMTQESYMYFAVHCVSAADQYFLAIDNIAIEAEDADDLSAALSAPASIGAGGTATVTATVTNNGTDAVQGYTVNFKANGNVISTQNGTSLAVGASATFTTQYATTSADAGTVVNFEVEVVYTDDDPSNNTASATMNVLACPPPENVQATGGQTGTMTWDAPTITPPTVNEGFDNTSDFPPFSIGGITASVHTGTIGDWTVYTSSSNNVYAYSNATFDNAYQPQAWTVFNTSISGSYDTHSGNQVMLSFCDAGTGNGQGILTTDHWLISPELSGDAQTITFWERVITDQYGNETYEVLASSTDNNPLSFTSVQTFSSSSTSWGQHSATLPSGTKYFAIHHTSYDIFGLMIDDVTYVAASIAPVSYNIYLEGQLVGNVLSTDALTYTFNNLSDGTYQCAVSAVYSYGESVAVPATFTIDTTNPTIEITPETQTISDAAAAALTITGTDIDGNINVSVGNDWSVNPTSLGNTGGDVSVSYTGRDLSATTTVTATAANDNTVTDEATVNYVADVYIVGDFGTGWNFSDNTHPMSYNNGTYTATITVNANNYILFARLLGNSNPWNTRDVFGPSSNGNWDMQGDNYGGDLNLWGSSCIHFPEGGTYRITINANDNTFTISKLNGEQTASPVITSSSDGEYVTITATGDGTVTLNVPGYDPVSGEGEVSITVPCGVVSNTITVSATAQETGKDESDPTYRDITIPAGSDWVEMDGTYDNPNDLLSFLKDGEDIMMLDQFLESTLNNDHPDHYTYTLRQTVNGETQTSTPVTIPVYKTNSSMQGLYTLNQVTGDTDMKLKPNVFNTKMNYDVNPDRNVLYYSLYRGDLNDTYPEITAQSRISQLQKFEEMVGEGENAQPQYFLFESHPKGIAPRYDRLGTGIAERLDTNWVEGTLDNMLPYVPVIWTYGLYTARGDGKNNSYGSDIKREYMGKTTAEINGDISQGANGTWKDINGTEYRAFHPTITVTGYLPQSNNNYEVDYNDGDIAHYEPYLCRAWCTNEGIHDYGRDADGHLEDLGELQTPFLVGDATFGDDLTAIIGGEWTHGSVRDPWSFGLPTSVAQDEVNFVIRFYYKKVVTEAQPQQNGSKIRLGNEPEGFFMAQFEGNADDMVVALNEFMNGIVPVDVTYVNPQGMKSSRPFDGVNIVVTRYSDGSTRTTKIIR